MCKSVFLISMVVMIFLACSTVPSAQGLDIFCSTELNNILDKICKSYNTMPITKRSGLGNDVDFALNPLQYVARNELEDSDDTDRPSSGNYLRNSLSSIRRRTRQGIVDRCCKNGCSMSVLLDYCDEVY
uniref:Probable insulin-like peptide 2 n=1 Tax=Drosophila rhopaloa TaxID=1041015 RepID=A0A6P4EQP3_DRORH